VTGNFIYTWDIRLCEKPPDFHNSLKDLIFSQLQPIITFCPADGRHSMFLTSQLIPRKITLLEKLIVPYHVKNVPAFYMASFLHKFQAFLRILSQMKPAHDTPPPPYTFLEKALVKCT
jgi:hypothetical protein